MLVTLDLAPRSYWSIEASARAATFPADRARVDVTASTLLQPTMLECARAEWRGY